MAQIRMRGPAEVLDSRDLARLTVRADLRGLGQGLHGIDVSIAWPVLPAEVIVEDVSPRRLFVRLAPVPNGTAKE